MRIYNICYLGWGCGVTADCSVTIQTDNQASIK